MSEPLPSPPLRRTPAPSLEAIRRLGSAGSSCAPGTTSQVFLALAFLNFQPVVSLPLKSDVPAGLSVVSCATVKAAEVARVKRRSDDAVNVWRGMMLPFEWLDPS